MLQFGNCFFLAELFGLPVDVLLLLYFLKTAFAVAATNTSFHFRERHYGRRDDRDCFNRRLWSYYDGFDRHFWSKALLLLFGNVLQVARPLHRFGNPKRFVPNPHRRLRNYDLLGRRLLDDGLIKNPELPACRSLVFAAKCIFNTLIAGLPISLAQNLTPEFAFQRTYFKPVLSAAVFGGEAFNVDIAPWELLPV